MKPLVITTKITSRESEAFKKYLKEVSDIDPFETPKDEYVCAMKAWDGVGGSGCRKAKEELIKRNLRFVISCAKQYQIKGVSIEDLVNEGNIGIAAAANRFDPTMGNKFISYAVWYIRKEITSYLSNYSRTIKLPINKVDAVAKFKKKIALLEQKLQRPVEESDILNEYDEYSKDDVDLLYELTNGDMTSLDMPVGEDGSASLYELLSDSSMGRADDLVMKADMEVNINRLFSVLKPSEKTILTMLFGLDGESPRTLADVGVEFGLSRESVRQKKEKAFKKIKGKFNNNAKAMLSD